MNVDIVTEGFGRGSIIEMDIREVLFKCHNVVEGSFGDLSPFDFSGVYVLCDDNDIVYVGSSYARTIKMRLSQYLRKSDSGNTLGKTIAKQLSGQKKYNELATKKMKDAVEKIKSLKIFAIETKDLEYHLIKIAKPVYNNCGKYED